MGLFQRKSRQQPEPTDAQDGSSDNKKDKGAWKRPANTAFKQQRLKAWQPILTPKTVLPTLFIIGILFAPIGGLLIWGSSKVTQITVDYTNCEDQSPSKSSSPEDLSLHDVSSYSYRLRGSDAHASVAAPQYAYVPSTAPATDITARNVCVVQFDIPYDLAPSVMFYYKLTNFFQNHRRYVKSLDTNQLKGSAVSASTLNDGSCKPLAEIDGKAIYPCGLIANSLFNDTYTNLTLLGGSGEYDFSYNGIAWPGEAHKYTNSPKYDPADIVPPPNWAVRYPQGYNASNIPQLQTDEHFQNWMRTSGLPTFTKLYGRNDHDTLQKGRYQISIELNFPVKPYKGTKSIVISTVSWIGGKNPFLGWAYVGAACLFVSLAILGTIRHVVKPRRLGDMSLLSWNR